MFRRRISSITTAPTPLIPRFHQRYHVSRLLAITKNHLVSHCLIVVFGFDPQQNDWYSRASSITTRCIQPQENRCFVVVPIEPIAPGVAPSAPASIHLDCPSCHRYIMEITGSRPHFTSSRGYIPKD